MNQQEDYIYQGGNQTNYVYIYKMRARKEESSTAVLLYQFTYMSVVQVLG